MLKKLQIIANVAIIAVSILLGYMVIKYFILNPPNVNRSAKQSKDTVKVGTKLTLQEIDWQKNGRTVLLVVSPTCRYCTESEPFYSKLSQQLSTQKSATLVALVPKGITDAPGYLRNLGVSANEVKQVAIDTLGVKGTPTIIIADKAGEVLGVWFGKLSSDQEEIVLSQLQAGPA